MASCRVPTIVLAALAFAIPVVAQGTGEHEGRIKANGIEIAYRIVGPEDREALLFIQGVGGVVPDEPDRLSLALVDEGFRVILFDNRDSGASTHLADAGMPDFGAIRQALAEDEAIPVAYTMLDMAADVDGLLAALDIEDAHIVGGSMGGMIAQIVAANHPERTASLTLISSTTGNAALAQGEPPTRDTPMEPAMARQAAAAVATGELRERSAGIKAATAIVHGDQDELFPLAHGEDLAATIPRAHLVIIPGMSHVPEEEHNQAILEAILAVAGQAAQTVREP